MTVNAKLADRVRPVHAAEKAVSAGVSQEPERDIEKETAPRHVLLVLVDGLGIPPEPLSGTIYRRTPSLCTLIAEDSVAVDASLGVPGTPQSATGQTAILTGVNAAKELGRHLSGFPNRKLREIIARENIFLKLRAAGFTSMFANAYARTHEQRLPRALQSVTTVAVLSAFGQPLSGSDMLAGNAVYHDLTRAWLREHGQPDVPLISEAEAAAHLLQIVRGLDFTLFEYFLTDHAGHRGTEEDRYRVLASLDSFIGALKKQLNTGEELLLLVSDHGNIESSETRLHTRNPVPFAAYGCGAAAARSGVASILDVTPRILTILQQRNGGAAGKC